MRPAGFYTGPTTPIPESELYAESSGSKTTANGATEMTKSEEKITTNSESAKPEVVATPAAVENVNVVTTPSILQEV